MNTERIRRALVLANHKRNYGALKEDEQNQVAEALTIVVEAYNTLLRAVRAVADAPEEI